MTPGARIQAAIELLERLEAGAQAADRAFAVYSRERRYMGSKDRAAVRALLYDTLRARARLDWHLEREGGSPCPRARVLALLSLVEGLDGAGLAERLGQGPHVPTPPDEAERALADRLAGRALDEAGQPDHVRAEWPAWLLPLSPGLDAAELAALTAPGALDLRANLLRGGRDEALDALAAEGIEAAPSRFSPWGLRVEGNPALDRSPSWREGLVEVQDEASQIGALLVGARPGETVVDFCAGAGGKSLALAAAMANRGRILACDVDAARLARMGPRLARAGARIVETHVLSGTAPPPPASADRVLVDAPCSGTGTWRRSPEAKWRFGPDALARRLEEQRAVLAGAAPLVRPGGRLVYATCSVLEPENEGQVAAFLAGGAPFRPVPWEEAWPAGAARPDCAGDFLRLTSARHGTDGFFVAILERTS